MRIQWGRFIRSALVAGYIFFTGMGAFAWDGPTDAAAWASLTNSVASNQVVLATLVGEANAAGLNTDYAYVSQVVVDRFQTFSQYDRDNPGFWSNAVANIWWGSKIPNSATFHAELPFDEMESCLSVSSNAIVELQQQLATNIVLAAPVDFSSGTLALTNSYYIHNGTPAFPSTFTWMPNDLDLLKAFGRMGGSFYQLTHLNADETTVNSTVVNNEKNDAFYQSSINQAPQQIFLGGALAGWMKTTYPQTEDGKRNFVQYDTDSPLVRGWLTKLFEGFLPPVTGASGSGDQPRLLMLANEPNFATRQGGWQADNGVSSNTMARYQTFLETRYTNDISYLNSTYGSSYTDFSAAQAGMTMPISTALQGGPVWYDWCRFNMDRINDFFSFLKTGTQSNDAGSSPVNIKILGPQLSDQWRDEGMDMEYLTKLQDVLGADNKASPSTATDLHINEDWSWTNRYGLNWMDQQMMLDFTKSICPDKAFYDSEWHGLSTGRWRDFSMDRNYVRSALWLGFTHGMSAMQAWYWPRDTDGSLRKGSDDAMIGSIVTLPEALDSYGRTFKELNAHADSVTRLVPKDRTFMIYYTEESAIQDLNYIPEMRDTYEALKLINVSVGFTTPTEIAGLSSSKTVVVPPVQFISDSSLSALQNFAASGGTVVQVNGISVSFSKNEQGLTRAGGSGLSPYAEIALSDAYTTAASFEDALRAIRPVPRVQMTLSGYGVLCSQTPESNGETTFSLINVSKDPRSVTLHLPYGGIADYRNLLTGQMSTNTFVMQPYDVLLLRTENSVPAPPPVTTVIEFDQTEGYADGDLTVHPDWSGNTGNIVSANGTGFNGASGLVDISMAQWKRGVNHTGLPSAAEGDEITLSSVFKFTSTNSVSGSRDLMSLTFYEAVSGGDSIRAAVRRTAGAGLGFFIANQNANPASSDVSSALAGLNADLGTSDWLKFSATLIRGATSNDWSMRLTLMNLTSNRVVDTFTAGGLGSTPGFFGTDRFYGAFSSSRADAEINSRIMDQFSFTVPGKTAWEEFVAGFGLSGVATNDFDGDGKNDLYEFALGGDPTNPADEGTAPSIQYLIDHNVSLYNLEPTNTYTGITYLAEWTTNLLTGPWNANWNAVTNYPSGQPAYHQAERKTYGGTNAHLFFRLKVLQP